MPLVSVITPCYNDGDYIMDCIMSVQESDYPNVEHIIVDDGSNQKTIDILNTVNFPNVKIFFKENEGVCIARNYAIEKATGEFLLPLDGDDKISRNYIKDAVSIFVEKPDTRLVTSEISQLFDHGDGQIIVKHPVSIDLLLSRNLFTVSSMVRKKDAIMVGGFDNDFHSALEDWEFWISIVELGGGIEVLPGVNFYYRIKRRHRNYSLDENEVRHLHRLIWEKHKMMFAKYYADPFATNTFESLMAFKKQSIFKLFTYKIKEWLKQTKVGKLYERSLT